VNIKYNWNGAVDTTVTHHTQWSEKVAPHAEYFTLHNNAPVAW